MNPSSSLRSPAELRAAGLLSAEDVSALEPVAARYAVAVTPQIVELIRAGAGGGAIARQFVPTAAELERRPEELSDPIGDGAHEAVPGVVHRYPDRALLKVVHACPVYCRFCFRREMVGPGGTGLAGAALERAIAYIAGEPRLWEIILTGGDPFMLSARRAEEIVRRLHAVPHLRVLRWHTRVPMVDPQRVTPAFVKALHPHGRATFVAIHANHPAEFTPAARAAVARLAEAGIGLLSQTVLLRGINNDAATLESLMRTFVENRIRPYYLHHGDLAPGTAHFRTTVAEGQALMRALRGRLSGLCLPEYVIDIPGGHGKVPIGPVYLDGDRLSDWRGNPHALGASG
jgi:lysine 2,3-aminomutase